jgi:hypothetical protein
MDLITFYKNNCKLYNTTYSNPLVTLTYIQITDQHPGPDAHWIDVKDGPLNWGLGGGGNRIPRLNKCLLRATQKHEK